MGVPRGQIEPGESSEEAAARETLEETGLPVLAAGIIGGRIHPRTGVQIVYVAAAPLAETALGIHEALKDLNSEAPLSSP